MQTLWTANVQEAQLPIRKAGCGKGQKYYTKKQLAPGKCVPLTWTDFPGTATGMFTYDPRNTCVSTMVTADYEVYVAVRCLSCADTDDCTWFVLQKWKYSMAFLALRGPTGLPQPPRTWSALCQAPRPGFQARQWQWYMLHSTLTEPVGTEGHCAPLSLPVESCDHAYWFDDVPSRGIPCQVGGPLPEDIPVAALLLWARQIAGFDALPAPVASPWFQKL
jgi:hypothetical protein